jgi:PAS domain S-box-containing protein
VTSSKKPPAAPVSPSWQDEPFRRLVDSVTDYAIFLVDPDGRIASWNRGAQRIVGYTPAEIVGQHISVFYPKSAVDKRWPEHELETAKRLGRFEDEGWRVRKDGSLFWANVVITAMRDEAGRLLGFSKITQDLTERRQNEERLRQSEERFRLIVEGAQDYAIFMLDPTGHVASWNAGAERIKGYRPSEIIGKHFSLFYPEEAIARDWPGQELREAIRLGRFEDEGWRVRKDGSLFWASVVIAALHDARGKHRGFSKITRDLTERRAAEDRLRQSEERFRVLLEGIEDYAIFMLDPEGRVTSWNTGAQRLMGYTPREIIGESLERFFTPEDIEAGRPKAELESARLNRRFQDQAWRVRKDGTRYWSDIVVTALNDGRGVLRGFAKVTRDLSERKRMESLEQQGRHLTEFLAMLAHELRNPLAPIRNALAIMAMQGDTSPQIAWSREVLERQTAHLTRLVDDLLDVSRITRGKMRLQGATMDFHAAIQRAVEAVRPLVDERRHRLHMKTAADPLPVNGDMTRLTQVVVNLLNNAAKYTPAGGDITLETAIEGDDVVLRVKDTGVGMPEQLLERVFDLFAQGERTLDRSEGGLGIGLTLARRIVMLHGGTIVARSEGVGKGSEFIMRLPRLRFEVKPSEETPAQVRLPRGAQKRSVLVVDDNADAAASMAHLLRMVGHEVEIEHDGRAALDHIARSKPDVLLLDIGLPGMSGYEVAKHVRARPEGQGLRIYALTGYGQEQDRQRAMESGFDGHLVKPVAPAELLALIDERDAAR